MNDLIKRSYVGGIEAVIEITREQDAQKARNIETWLNQVASTYNVLAMDAVILGQ